MTDDIRETLKALLRDTEATPLALIRAAERLGKDDPTVQYVVRHLRREYELTRDINARRQTSCTADRLAPFKAAVKAAEAALAAKLAPWRADLAAAKATVMTERQRREAHVTLQAEEALKVAPLEARLKAIAAAVAPMTLALEERLQAAKARMAAAEAEVIAIREDLKTLKVSSKEQTCSTMVEMVALKAFVKDARKAVDDKVNADRKRLEDLESRPPDTSAEDAVLAAAKEKLADAKRVMSAELQTLTHTLRCEQQWREGFEEDWEDFDD